jgi:hypothetical protein
MTQMDDLQAPVGQVPLRAQGARKRVVTTPAGDPSAEINLCSSVTSVDRKMEIRGSE